MQDTNDQLRAIDPDTAVDSPTEAVAVGKTVAGKYDIVRQIGKGGMGRVFLAEDITLGRRRVAIKVIDFPTHDRDKRQVIIERFRREAVAAAKVTHPNVIVIYSFKEIAGDHVQVMEYIDGRTLKEELLAQPEKALQPGRAAKIVIEFLKGVSALHAAGLCHRDLKPTNVMLTHDGDRVKILDLGLVKFADSDELATDLTLTQCGIPMGSPLYMAPEQINALPDSRNIDTRTDIYAVGVILFQLLTGKTPFAGLMDRSLFDQHLFDKVPMMVSPFGELSATLQGIVEKAMAKKSSDRFQTADEMRDALKRLLRPPVQMHNRLGTLGMALIGPTVIAIAALILVLGRPPHQLVVIPDFPSGQGTDQHQGVRDTAQRHDVVAPPIAPGNEGIRPAPTGAQAAYVTQLEPTAETTTYTATVVLTPPPADEVVLTTKTGCEAYVEARTGEAVTILTGVIAKSPGDADALYCLCGSYARKPSLADSEREVCKSFLNRASKHDKRRLQASMWLKPGTR